MASELHVDAIKHSGGTSSMTIDSSGNTTLAGNLTVSGSQILTANRPAFSVLNTSSVTISGLTALVFSTATFNIGNHFELSTGKFTAPVNGIYLFTFKTLLYNMGTGEYFDFYPYINGSQKQRFELTGNGGGHTQFDYSELVQLSANDEFRLYGNNRGIGDGYAMYTNENRFTGCLIG
tara:strand:- start:51 stop:584 length:534 start_codon:yes stop_codon:yes gene_type:complete